MRESMYFFRVYFVLKTKKEATELANKMLRVCSMKLSDDERAVCTYGSIGRNIAL